MATTKTKTKTNMKMKMTSSYLFLTLFVTLTSPFFFNSYGFVNADQIQISDIEDLKSKLDDLERLVEMTELEIYKKGDYILKYEKQVEELSQTVHQLESDFSHVEESPDYEKVINVYEEQVQELRAGVKRNEKELQLLKLRAKDSEDKVDSLAAQVKTMAVIVPELWFHIQKLEQAQEVIERRTAELRRYLRNQRCSFFKFMNSFGGRRYQEMAAPYTSEAIKLLKRSLSAVKKYHHQLQVVVQRKMNKHKLTAVLAGEESVFFLASIIFIFPIILARIWLSSRLR